MSAVALLLGLAACGGGGDADKKEGSGLPTQDPDMTFTGDPVTVMTMSTYDTDTLNAKPVLDIAQGAAHRITNAHEEELVIIEVQRGGYTGEDDICRLEDDYGRSADSTR